MISRAQSVLAVLALVLGPAAAAETLYISTGNQLRSFDSDSPGLLESTLDVTGLAGGERLVGIDFRPASGQLFGLGSSGRLYTLDRATGAAVQVGSDSFSLVGNHFGFNFDPTVDRIRVVSDQHQNLRLHPDTGEVVAIDTALGFASSDTNGGNAAVGAASFTHSVAGFTSTTLYDIELTHGLLVTQDPANGGTLNTVGPLGVTSADAAVGFDISGRTGTAYLAVNRGSGTNLYTVDLANGATTLVGAIGNPPLSGVTGLAVVPSEGSCVPSTTALCLNRDRFQVSAVWQTADGTRGLGQAVQLTSETGYFWFFSSSNLELIVKVLDACSSFQRTWVFASGLTDVGVTLTVTDTRDGTTNTYTNAIGTPFRPIQDTHAFTTCP